MNENPAIVGLSSTIPYGVFQIHTIRQFPPAPEMTGIGLGADLPDHPETADRYHLRYTRSIMKRQLNPEYRSHQHLRANALS